MERTAANSSRNLAAHRITKSVYYDKLISTKANEIKAKGMVEEVYSGRVGERVRGLRRERGWTLEALAERSGVSRAMISKVERGEKNPTLVVAAKVAEGLGVSLSQLVGIEERRKVVVVPKGKRMTMRDSDTGFERQLLSPKFGELEFSRNVVPEDSTSGELQPHRRGIAEYLVVEKGRLRIVRGDEEYVLDEGDSAYFESDSPHRLENAGRGECSYYLVTGSRGS